MIEASSRSNTKFYILLGSFVYNAEGHVEVTGGEIHVLQWMNINTHHIIIIINRRWTGVYETCWFL